MFSSATHSVTTFFGRLSTTSRRILKTEDKDKSADKFSPAPRRRNIKGFSSRGVFLALGSLPYTDPLQSTPPFTMLYHLVLYRQQGRYYQDPAQKAKTHSMSLVSSSQMDMKQKSHPLPVHWPISQHALLSCWRFRTVHIFCLSGKAVLK